MILLLLACKGSPDAPPASFPTPWESAADADETVSGGFLAEVGSALPGAGWFESDLASAQDAATVDVVEAGATWPVVRVRIVGHRGDGGWDTLELDVAENRWIAGDVALDGDDAVGILTSGAEVRYLVGGTISLDAPGLSPGETARGAFDDVPTRH